MKTAAFRHASPGIIFRKAGRILLTVLICCMLAGLCACSRDSKEPDAGQQPEKQEEAVTLDSVFSLMTNGSTEMCLEQLKTLGDDSAAADWLSFIDLVKEDRFDEAKALFLRLTDAWPAESKSLTDGNLYGLSRFINRWCKECGVASLRYLSLVEHAGASGTDITELCRSEAKQELNRVTAYGAPAWHAGREEYQQLLHTCGTDPRGAVLVAVDPGGDEVIIWTGVMALMPGETFSDDPANYEYLIRIEQGQTYQGTYNNNTKGYTRTCTVSLSQISSGTVLFSRTCEPHKAPETTTATKQDTYGNAYTIAEVQDSLYEAVSRLLDYTADEYLFLPGADRTAICFRYDGTKSSLNIPVEIKGRPVTEIGDHFASWSGLEERLTAVEMPDSVRRIGREAFAKCKKLETFHFPAELEIIGSSAFLETPALTSAVLSDSCKSVQDHAFSGSGIRELHVPSGMERISSYCFASCKNLTSLEIPGTIRLIGTHAFVNCSGLVSLTVGEGCEEIGTSAFQNCESLREAVIPESTAVGSDVFLGCSQLKP